MSATTAGAVKALLEAAGLGVAVYRDRAPEGATLPYVTVSEALSVVPERAFSAYDDPEGHVTERLSVDVWQQARSNQTRGVTKNYTLPDALCLALRATGLPGAPTHVAGVQLISRVRLYEAKDNVIHDAVTVDVRRTLQPIGG